MDSDLHLWKMIYVCGLVIYICEYILHDIDPIADTLAGKRFDNPTGVSEP